MYGSVPSSRVKIAPKMDFMSADNGYQQNTGFEFERRQREKTTLSGGYSDEDSDVDNSFDGVFSFVHIDPQKFNYNYNYGGGDDHDHDGHVHMDGSYIYSSDGDDDIDTGRSTSRQKDIVRGRHMRHMSLQLQHIQEKEQGKEKGKGKKR